LQRRQYKSLVREFQQATPRKISEKLKKISEEFTRQAADQVRTSSTPETFKPSHHEKLEEIRQTVLGIVQPAAPEAEKEQDSLSEAFRRVQKQKEKRDRQKDHGRDPGRGMSR